jgi:hypothetical protein
MLSRAGRGLSGLAPRGGSDRERSPHRSRTWRRTRDRSLLAPIHVDGIPRASLEVSLNFRGRVAHHPGGEVPPFHKVRQIFFGASLRLARMGGGSPLPAAVVPG